jgi:hypothetical protein
MGGTCGTYGERRGADGILVRKPARDTFEDLGVDGKIILKWIFKEQC